METGQKGALGDLGTGEEPRSGRQLEDARDTLNHAFVSSALYLWRGQILFFVPGQ